MDLTRQIDIIEESNPSENSLKSIRDSQSPESCVCCKYRERYPRLSHIKCSLHRDCTGPDKWTPNKCTACKQELRLMSNKSSINKRRSKLHFDRMLTETQLELNKSDRHWEFHKQAREFFNKFSPFPMWQQNMDDKSITDIPQTLQSQSSPRDDRESERATQSDSQSSNNSFDYSYVEPIIQNDNYNCSTTHCSNTMASAQCNDPIHNVGLNFSTFFTRGPRNKKPLRHLNTSILPEIDYTKNVEYTPITRYRSDPITGEPYFIFDSRIHLRVGATRINLVLPNISNDHLMIKSLEVTFTSDNASFQIRELPGRKNHHRITEFWLETLRSNPPINLD